MAEDKPKSTVSGNGYDDRIRVLANELRIWEKSGTINEIEEERRQAIIKEMAALKTAGG